MPYVGPPFEHDLFVSYSHGSDAQGQGLLQPWSAAFVRELDRELRSDRRFRDTLRVFLDADHRPGRGVDPMDPLTPQLEREVGAAALLLVLMSPDYLASAWCRHEREAWLRRQREFGLPADGRVAVVRIWPTREPWPAELCDAQGVPLVGFAFHDDSAGVARPLGWTDEPGAFGREFKRALLGVVGQLSARLDELQERAALLQRAAQDVARLQGAGEKSIYLHGRSEQRQAWELAAITLADRGYAVLPGEPDPPAHTPQQVLDLRQQRVEAMADCDALLLLGTTDGRALDTDLLAVARHDRQSARARSQRLLPCGVLDTVGPAIATPVRRATARNLQADWLDGTHEPWTPAVQQWLTAKGAEAEQRQ
jgi:hypothetical protein